MYDSNVIPMNKNKDISYQITALIVVCEQTVSCDLSLSGTLMTLPQPSMLENIELLLSYYEGLPVLAKAKAQNKVLSFITDESLNGQKVTLQLNYSATNGYAFFVDVPEVVSDSISKNEVALAIHEKLLDLEDEIRAKSTTDNLEFRNGTLQLTNVGS